jgi:hypothetical protein
MGFLLLGAVLVVYIVLGILYESFIHPLTILSGLPAAAVGALLTLWLFKMPITLYAFVGMIMLVGIVKKNAIMMIDFALVREREHGVSATEAIAEAARIRFRPIMMTTMARSWEVCRALGYGQGGAARQPLGFRCREDWCCPRLRSTLRPDLWVPRQHQQAAARSQLSKFQVHGMSDRSISVMEASDVGEFSH